MKQTVKKKEKEGKGIPESIVRDVRPLSLRFEKRNASETNHSGHNDMAQ